MGLYQIKTTKSIEGLVPLWFGKDGKVTPLHEIKDAHLLNILKMYHRMAKGQIHEHMALLCHAEESVESQHEMARITEMSTADWLGDRTDYEILYNEAHQRGVKFGSTITDDLCDYINGPECNARTMEIPTVDTPQILDELRNNVAGLKIL